MSGSNAGRRRTQLRSSSSLVALLQALQGQQLAFELRNDVNVTGKLTSCDEHMNLFVDNAIWQPFQGPAKLYPFLFVKGRHLRMVHLPDQLDAATTLDAYVQQLKKQRVAAVLDLMNKPQHRLAKGELASAGVDQVADEGNSDGEM